MIIDGTSKNEKFNKLREEEKIQICPMLQGARVHVWSGPREVKNHCVWHYASDSDPGPSKGSLDFWLSKKDAQPTLIYFTLRKQINHAKKFITLC